MLQAYKYIIILVSVVTVKVFDGGTARVNNSKKIQYIVPNCLPTLGMSTYFREIGTYFCE